MSWGAAVFDDTQYCSGPALLAAADAALLAAKKLGRGRCSAVPETSPTPVNSVSHQYFSGQDAGENHSLVVDGLVQRFIEELDEHHPPPGTSTALEILAREAHRALDVAAWTLSRVVEGSGVRYIAGLQSGHVQSWGHSSPNDATTIRDAPALAASRATVDAALRGTAFVASVDLDGSDPAEIATLTKLGYRAVLAIGVPDSDDRYLLQLFSTNGHQHLIACAPHLRVLAHYCTRLAVVDS